MVAIHEETVAFIKATDYLKEDKEIDFNTIAEQIGLTYSQMNMVRVNRRKIKQKEIDRLVECYPDVRVYFEKEQHSPQTMLNEPMAQYNSPTNVKLLLTTVSTQQKLIERLEHENKTMRDKLTQLEQEKKTMKAALLNRKKT